VIDLMKLSLSVLLAMSALSARAESIEPPDAHASFRTKASGVQIYACEYDANHALGWVFKAPRATLFDEHGIAVIEHSAGPSWAASDGSRIEGRVLAQTPSDTPDSVPQLLLRAHSTGTEGRLSTVRYVQRVNTVGGMKPSAPCAAEHELGSSPYLATYVFYQ
jgi:hypothetical protein